MRIAVTRPLFDWQSLEDSPTLASLRELLASIPDGQLLEGLAAASRAWSGRLSGDGAVGRGPVDGPLAAQRLRGLPGRIAAQRRAAAADRHRRRESRAQEVEHLAVHGGPGQPAAPHAAGGDVRPDGAAFGRGGAELGKAPGGRRHGLEGRRSSDAKAQAAEARPTACRNPAVAAKNTATMPARSRKSTSGSATSCTCWSM